LNAVNVLRKHAEDRMGPGAKPSILEMLNDSTNILKTLTPLRIIVIYLRIFKYLG